jgi:hypothetical protein
MKVPQPHGVGDPVKVTISYPFELITPLFPKRGGLNVINLTTLATQIIVTE